MNINGLPIHLFPYSLMGLNFPHSILLSSNVKENRQATECDPTLLFTESGDVHRIEVHGDGKFIIFFLRSAC